ncbi:hypothetical protein LINPERHAP1_LOCUS14153 [Linum perenne]
MAEETFDESPALPFWGPHQVGFERARHGVEIDPEATKVTGSYSIGNWRSMWQGAACDEHTVIGPGYFPSGSVERIARVLPFAMLPSSREFAVASRLSTIGNCPPGWHGIWTEAFTNGLRLPPSSFVIDLLQCFGASLGAFNVGCWASASAFECSCVAKKIAPHSPVVSIDSLCQTHVKWHQLCSPA